MSVVLQIIGSLLGIVATWYLGKFISKWYQAYRHQRQKSAVKDMRKDSQARNQKANKESDKLKGQDGR